MCLLLALEHSLCGTFCALKWNEAAFPILMFPTLANGTRDGVACAVANITETSRATLTICLPSIVLPPFAHRWKATMSPDAPARESMVFDRLFDRL